MGKQNEPSPQRPAGMLFFGLGGGDSEDIIGVRIRKEVKDIMYQMLSG
jgi:hypothetical protein